MRNIRIEDVVIVGGGSSGWLTALFLLKNFKHFNVTLIESDKISHIGVGESTQPAVSNLIYHLGYEQTEWMPRVNATYKLGVMFNGWSDTQFIVDSESVAWSILDTTEYGYFGAHDVAIASGMTAKEWSDWFPIYRMAINNKSPKFGKHRFNYLDGNLHVYNNAVQWDNLAVQSWMRSECKKLGVTHIIDNVVDVNLDEQAYIKELVLEAQPQNVSGDFYIDCSGFSSILFNSLTIQDWDSVENILPNNNAVVVRKTYQNPQQECHPYTGSTAMDAGWMWTIPTYNDLSYGYVYSDKYIDKDDAEKELRTKINEWDASALHVPFRAGQRKRISYKNAYAVGLSGAFVEPLEATNLAFTVHALYNLRQLLSENKGVYNDENIAPQISEMFSSQVDQIIDFIYMHYRMSTKEDTLYWKDIKEKPIPDKILPMYNRVIDKPLSISEHLDRSALFGPHHWWQLLKGCNRYENIHVDGKSFEWPYTKEWEEFTQYGKLMMDVHSNRIDNVLKVFPNHYDYLTEWYEDKSRQTSWEY